MTSGAEASAPILHPGRNCPEPVHAQRLAILHDTASYYRAFADALAAARHDVFIIGWDFHSEIDLIRNGGRLKMMDALLQAVTSNPDLTIRIAIWDDVFFYAFEREWFQSLKLAGVDERILFVLDDTPPVGAAMHQKIVAVDDALVFTGGVDLAQRRWDTSEHTPHDPRRIDPRGASYPPFHDVQIAMTGQAARATAALARRRWEAVTGELAPVTPEPSAAAWPAWLEPDFRDVDVALLQTRPGWTGERALHHVEDVYIDAFAAARDTIYIENQYFTSRDLTACLARRLREPDGPEVVIVGPARGDGWLEQKTIAPLRGYAFELLYTADEHNRLRIVYPMNEDTPVFVHSKICVVDDQMLRIGSANLTNRSMGVDLELDVALEARDEAMRRRIREVRNRMVGIHLGMSPGRVEELLRRHRSLRAVIDASVHRRHRLVRVPKEIIENRDDALVDQEFIDPRRPLRPERVARELFEATSPRGPYRRLRRIGKWALMGTVGACAIWLTSHWWRTRNERTD